MSDARRHPLWLPVRRILREDWNPVGGAAPDDEYDNYVWMLVGKVHHGASTAEIADCLAEITNRWFGHDEPADSYMGVAAKLVSLRTA